MTHAARFLTRCDRAYRREKLIAAYLRGQGCSRTLAARFGFSSDGYVRAILRDAGVAGKRGRPSTQSSTGSPGGQ